MEGTLVREWEGAPGRAAGSRVSSDPRSLTAGPDAVLWVDEERFRQLVAEGIVERLPLVEERLVTDKTAPAAEFHTLPPLPTLPPLEEPEP